MVSEAEIQENHEKNDSKNHVFFACVFKSILERFGEGFGRGLGPPWRLLGHFGASFFKALLPRGPKRVQEAAKRSLGLDLGRFWRGFGKGLGGQNGPKIEISGIFLDMLFQKFILVDFFHFLPTSMLG